MKYSQSTIDRACQALMDGATIAEVPALAKTPRQSYRVEHDLGDRVYLVVRSEPIEGIVTGIGIRPGGHWFNVRWADGREEGHFGIELTTEAPI